MQTSVYFQKNHDNGLIAPLFDKLYYKISLLITCFAISR